MPRIMVSNGMLALSSAEKVESAELVEIKPPTSAELVDLAATTELPQSRYVQTVI